MKWWMASYAVETAAMPLKDIFIGAHVVADVGSVVMREMLPKDSAVARRPHAAKRLNRTPAYHGAGRRTWLA
jgi:hypothetical protein